MIKAATDRLGSDGQFNLTLLPIGDKVMQHFTFSTADIDAAIAFPLWFDEILPRLEVEPHSAEAMNFFCSIVGRRTRGIAIARVEISSDSGVWYEKAQPFSADDSLRIYRVESGMLSLKTRSGGEHHVEPGDAFVSGPEAVTQYSIAPAEPGVAALVGDMTAIPFCRLEEYGRFFPRDLARPLPHTPTGNIINTYVEALSSDDTQASEFLGLMNSFTELVAVTMGECGNSPHSQARDDMYCRALAHIRRHHTNPSLTVEEIATVLGVSERALFAAFDDREFTPHRYINRMRIETAKSLLSDSGGKPNIMEIAFNSGFESVSTFNRQFRSQTGVSPSKFRAR